MDSFRSGVDEKLKHYVYLLIDPRNGKTFYVGRGQNNRVFDHIKAAAKLREKGKDGLPLRLETIKQIIRARLEPVHVIHRHGMDEKTAKEVEAALIDYIPGLTNEIAGQGSGDYGPTNAEQLQDRYGRLIMKPDPSHKLLYIKVRQETVDDRGLYEAVRSAWRLNPEKANAADYILAVVNGVCNGVFVTTGNWKPSPGRDNRWYFEGKEIHDKVAKEYVGKLIPADKRKRGMASPVLYSGYRSRVRSIDA